MVLKLYDMTTITYNDLEHTQDETVHGLHNCGQ